MANKNVIYLCIISVFVIILFISQTNALMNEMEEDPISAMLEATLLAEDTILEKQKPVVVKKRAFPLSSIIGVTVFSIIIFLLLSCFCLTTGLDFMRNVFHRITRRKVRKYDTLKSPLRAKLIRMWRLLPCNPYFTGSAIIGISFFLSVVVIICITQNDWGLWISIYFVTVMLTSVGYGDYVPTTVISKIVVMISVMIGMVMIAYALGMIGTYFISSSEKKILQMVQRNVNINASAKVLDISRIFVSFAIFIVLILVGTVTFKFAEGWSFLDSAYFSLMTISTVGFGDLRPTTNFSLVFTTIYIIIGTTSAGLAIGTISNYVVESYINRKREKRIILSEDVIRKMDYDKDGKVTKLDFLIFKLIHHYEVPSQWIRQTLTEFNQLDKDGSNLLDEDDLKFNINNLMELDDIVRDNSPTPLKEPLDEDYN